jgi:hypothetical protein
MFFCQERSNLMVNAIKQFWRTAAWFKQWHFWFVRWYLVHMLTILSEILNGFP